MPRLRLPRKDEPPVPVTIKQIERLRERAEFHSDGYELVRKDRTEVVCVSLAFRNEGGNTYHVYQCDCFPQQVFLEASMLSCVEDKASLERAQFIVRRNDRFYSQIWEHAEDLGMQKGGLYGYKKADFCHPPPRNTPFGGPR